MSTAAESSQPPGQFYCPTCEQTFAAGDSCPNDGTRLVRLKVTDPLIGRTLDNRYTLGKKLGQGGMGAVYHGTDKVLGRDVAIKLVTPQLVSDADVVKRFLREAKLASKLSHPNAVSVLDFGQTEDGMFYLVMELVTGRTLDQVVKAEKVLRPERIIRIGSQVLDALEVAHSLQIVHRDLKPANIMLLERGRDLVKVLDFGLAKSLAPDQTSTTMTNAGSLLGTPAFMPPELALGQPCDGRADQYSLGCILYLLGSGRLPFVSDSPHELIAMHGTQQAPPMEGVPPGLAAVIDRMLQKDPAHRFQSAAENREALEASFEYRMMTPVSGLAKVAMSSSPSHMTPAPRADATPPRIRSSSEIDRLVTSDTMAASAPTMAAPTGVAAAPSIVPTSRGTWKIPALLGAVVLVGAGTFALVASTKKAAPKAPAPAVSEPAPTPTPVETPAPVEAPKPPQPAVSPAPTEPPPQPTEVTTTKAVESAAGSAAPEMLKKPTTTKPSTKTAKTTQKATAQPKDSQKSTKPADSHKAAKDPALPF